MMEMRITHARSATKHRISRERSAYVIEHCGFVLILDPPAGAPVEASRRLLYLGEDSAGTSLEVMAVELAEGDLLVIHAMELREKYRNKYEEVKRWRLKDLR